MKDLNTLNKFRQHKKEIGTYGTKGDSGNGVFKVFVAGKSFWVIASNGGGWEHVSVHPCNAKRCPTWEEMCAVKDLFFEPEEVAIQFHPAKSNYVNNHPYCLHLWRPTDNNFPTPPTSFV